MAERIISVPASQQMEADTVDYMIEVNRKRQIPNNRDNLKPVQRRIIDTMVRFTNCMNTTVKSATVVGLTMACSHPHGDSSIYNAMKPLTNWFEELYPIIDGQGNFGSLYGDEAAASRYTEVEISAFAKDALGLREVKAFPNITDWIPTYDNKNEEPEYFPSIIPISLVEGCFGIGMGIKTELPPHNLGEVIDATIELLHNPNTKIALIPDQCMPCYVFSTDFELISNKGHGSVTFRGIIDIEKRNNRDALIIKSKPDMVYIESVHEKIEELANQKQIQLEDWYEEDAYTREGEKFSYYVVELKKGADPYYTRDIIYKKTEMQHTITISFESLDDEYKPVRYSYKSYIQSFIEFRKLTLFRVIYAKLQSCLTRQHQIEAFIKALTSGQIDDIIQRIKTSTSKTDEALIEYLIQLLDITDLQAKYITDAGLKKLKPAYLEELQTEYNQLQTDIYTYKAIIEDDNLIIQQIETELLAFKKKYNKPRNTIVIDAQTDTIPQGEFKLVITQNNFIKKLPINMQGVGNLKGDKVKTIIKVDNTKDILIFDEIGKVYRLPVHKIPVSDKSSNGTDVRLLCKNLTSNIVTVMYLPTVTELAQSVEPYYLTAITANGNIKKLELQDFISVPLSGIIFFKLDNDGVKDVKIVHDKLDIVVYSSGEALRIPMSDVPLQKRNTKGVKSMNNTSVIDGFGIVTPDTTNVIVITNNGKVNKLNISALPLSERNKKSTRIIKLGKGDSIFNVHMCNEHNTLHVVTTGDKLDILISDIQDGSSISSGKPIISLKGNIILRTNVN